jgi:hypothetical protein
VIDSCGLIFYARNFRGCGRLLSTSVTPHSMQQSITQAVNLNSLSVYLVLGEWSGCKLSAGS